MGHLGHYNETIGTLPANVWDTQNTHMGHSQSSVPNTSQGSLWLYMMMNVTERGGLIAGSSP